ncbi:hypothetical protein CI109_105905 [Kwoniella shandongensis]|uniref:Uncharacterized protein n=1 Tax=Kwoniella shandongensis TaxID=1734106 RepID=A0A5M6BTW0_9TREE|nr:uncharacterized protein CI109_006665 [Kwoniella shandongensis]KAA5525025.1 hypothetical protein CI109_006665 [Kwoniella shandongensis]
MSRGDLKVAIVGAGPGGLAAIINFLRVSGIDLSVFEGARELKEIGAGIGLNQNTWRHLQLLGVADKLEEFANRGDGTKIDVENRNGNTGHLISRRYQSVDPDTPARSRIERYKLQNALLSGVPKDLIQLNKKLVEIKESDEGVTLFFKDGTDAGPFDLVIGADGIRSVTRSYAFPDHKLSYTGKTAYRILIPQSAVAHIPDIPQGSCFWHTKATHVYTNPLDNGLFEIATRAVIPDTDGTKTSWGQEVSKEEVVGHYSGYCETIRKVIDAPDKWLEFAIFGGPRLDSVIHNDRIALLGDASHPLSGAFGAGAAFAFEDAHVLAQSIRHALETNGSIAQALRDYDQVRAPHYKALYEILDVNAGTAKEIELAQPELNDDEFVEEIVAKGLAGNTQWIYQYDVTKVWKDYLASRLEDKGSIDQSLVIPDA